MKQQTSSTYSRRYSGSGKSNPWETLKTLGHYLARFRVRILIALVFLLLAKCLIIAVPIALREIVNWFDATINPNPIIAVPILLLFTYGLLRVGNTFFTELRNAVFARASQRTVRTLGVKVFKHLHRLSHAFHQERQTGGISRDIERGTRGVNYLLFFLVFSIVPTAFEILAVSVYLGLNFEFIYVIATVGTIIAYCWFTAVVTAWRTKFRERMNEAETRTNATSVDALLNYETVKYFNNEEHETNRFDTHLREWEKASITSEKTLAFLNIGQGSIIAIGLVCLLYLAATDVVAGTITLGDFIMLNAFLMQMYIPLGFLGTTLREVNHAMTDIRNMFDLLDVDDILPEREDAPPLEITGPAIRFNGVEFSYAPTRSILRTINIDVPPGHKVAVVGRSGSGKSTLVRLLFRFYDVTGGSVTIDGQDLRDVTLSSLHKVIGVVPQDTVLFNDTLYYNIKYGRPECTDEELTQAVEQAQLTEFIESLPEGYETVVGERGLKLSGGERQRVAIARTLLKDPPILILDEATSSLDSRSEKMIQEALEVVSQNRTTLVIAHRLSTIADANKIYVLEQGKVIESGSHSELLALNGTYADMWWLQQEDEDTINKAVALRKDLADIAQAQ